MVRQIGLLKASCFWMDCQSLRSPCYRALQELCGLFCLHDRAVLKVIVITRWALLSDYVTPLQLFCSLYMYVVYMHIGVFTWYTYRCVHVCFWVLVHSLCHLPSLLSVILIDCMDFSRWKSCQGSMFWVVWSPTETPLRFKYSNAVAQTAIFVGGKLWSSPSFPWLHLPFLWAELWRQVLSCFTCLLKLQRTDGGSTMKVWGTSVMSHGRTKTCWKRWGWFLQFGRTWESFMAVFAPVRGVY